MLYRRSRVGTLVIHGMLVIACAPIVARSRNAFAADDPTYEKQIAPFLKTYCVGCHDGGDDSKGGLSVLSHKTLLAGGDSGEAIVAGKSDESRLVKMLLGTAKPKMPPKDAKQPKAEEIALFKAWVDLGAKGPVSTAPQSADELDLPKIQPKRPVAAEVSSVQFSPDGRWLAAARHRQVFVVDAATGAIARVLNGAENPINAVAFSPNSARLAAAEGLPSVVGKVRLWDLHGDQAGAPRVLSGHADSIYALAFSPDGTQLVTASYDKLLILWDVATGAEKHVLKHHTGAVFGLAFSPDGQTLASVAADQTVKLWNVASGQRILTLTEPTKGLSAVAFHPQGNELAAVGVDKMIRLYDWNGTTAKLKRSAFAHDAPILAAVFSPDGQTLFTASEDRRIKAWDVAKLRERHVYAALPDWPMSLAIHPDGTRLAAGLYDGELLVLDAKSRAKLQEIPLRDPSLAQASPIQNPKSKIENPAQAVAAGEPTPEQPAPPAAKPNPPTPRLDSVSPRTVVRGNKIKFTLNGQNIAAADRIFVSKDALQATLLPADMAKPNQAFCEIDIPADFDPGMISLRVHTPLGSAGSKPFYVGPFPEMGEKEDNNSPDKATPAMLPRTLSGTINARGDGDVWSFDAKAGEELVFDLFGPALGSALQARLSLVDEAGHVLKSVVRQPSRLEVVLGHRFENAGRYFLQVEDRDNTGGGNHYYYIHAGAFPYVTSTWPLAMRGTDQGESAPGEVTSIALTGFNLLPDSKQSAVPGAGPRFARPLGAESKALNAVRYESSPYPEFAARPNGTPQEAQPLPIPGAASGRIRGQESGDRSQAADNSSNPKSKIENPKSNHYSFTAKRGDRLTIETFARRIGSPLDTVLDILDPDGKPVPRATLRAVAETYTVLRDHDSKVKGIRLQAWDDYLPANYLLIGDEVVKVQILPLGPDEDVKFFDKNGSRVAWFGTTPEAHALNTPAYRVELHPPGSTFPPNGMPVVPLYWRNDDAPGLQGDSQIFFDVPADGTYVVRVRDVRGIAGDDFVYRLVIRPRHEDFRVSLDPETPNIPRGGSLPVVVNLDRLDGFNGPVDIRIDGLPPGITATTTRIGPDLYTGVLTLTASEAAPGERSGERPGEPGVSAPGSSGAPAASTLAALANPSFLAMRGIASAAIDGKTVEHATTPGMGSHHLTITSPPDILIAVTPTSAEIVPGQELRFTATIERRNGLKARVPVEVLNLPFGLRVLDVGLNGVLINENETSRSFEIICDPWAEPGPVTFYAAAKVEAKNERHGSAPLVLEVKSARSPVAAKE